jgi:hypothetical protein
MEYVILESRLKILADITASYQRTSARIDRLVEHAGTILYNSPCEQPFCETAAISSCVATFG